MLVTEIHTEATHDELAMSLNSLMKTNDGLFKSDKQAKFILSQAVDNQVVTGGDMYGNTFTMFYNLDDKGVVSVEKYLPKKGTSTITWERPTEGKTAVQVAKSQASAKRHNTAQLKAAQKTIDSFDDRISAHGENASPEMKAMLYAELYKALTVLNKNGEQHDTKPAYEQAVHWTKESYKNAFDNIIKEANKLKEVIDEYKDSPRMQKYVPKYEKELEELRDQYRRYQESLKQDLANLG